MFSEIGKKMANRSEEHNYVFGVVRVPDPPWTTVTCIQEDPITGFLNFRDHCKNRLGAAMEVTNLVAQFLGWNVDLRLDS